MAKEAQSRILDIGIGSGGGYIDLDGPGTLRVGMDMYNSRLKKLKQHYATPVCRADAEDGLPFPADTFPNIEMMFPHNELLCGLVTAKAQLWKELYRVLKDGGSVEIVFDVPPEGYREIEFKDGKIVRLLQPEDRMWRVAANFGFEVAVKMLTRSQVRAIGSKFAYITAKHMKDPHHKAYLLQAFKHGENLIR